MESNPRQRVKLQLAVIAAGAVVVMGTLAATVLGQEGTLPVAVGRMNTGQTTTSTTAPTAIVTQFASPPMRAARPRGFG